MEALSVSTSSAETKQDLKVTQQTTPAGAPTRRRQERLASDRALVISWRDARGVLRHTSGRVANVSRSGIMVESEQRIYSGTIVHVQTSNSYFLGTAAVRHCTEKGSKYNIGFYTPERLLSKL